MPENKSLASFPEGYDLLLREAAFASRSLGVGLTELRQYNFANKGAFLHASVSIAIGLERLLKLIVILAHRKMHAGVYPTNEDLKRKFGHRLPALIERVREISAQMGIKADWAVYDENLSKEIVRLLSEFATSTRYYNLDALTGGTTVGPEPLAAWEKSVGKEITSRHPRKVFREDRFDEFCKIMDSAGSYFHIGDSGQSITSAKEYFTAWQQIEPKQRYSVFYTYRLIRVLANLLHDIEFSGREVTFLYEFFGLFRVDDDKWILRKRSWTQ